MNNADQVRKAAYNNAVWCDLVCRAHGFAGEFTPGIWINRHPTPEFYPNAVTTSDRVNSVAQLQIVSSLVAAKISDVLAVKDSFSNLDLASLGFEVLFEAQWIYRPASTQLPRSHIDGLRWTKIVTAPDLIKWENAWRGESAEQSNSSPSRIFMPALLNDPAIAILAGYRDEKIVAGVIANRSRDPATNHNDDGVVGMSNQFAPAGDDRAFGIECLAAVIATFPNLPIVGYESGPALTSALSIGFEALAPLRIWSKK